MPTFQQSPDPSSPLAALASLVAATNNHEFLSLKAQRGVSTVTFGDPNVYRTQPATRLAAVRDTVKYAAICGADKAGAESIEIAGGYHTSRTDRVNHITGLALDKNGDQLYFHRRSDNTYWERLHIPEDTPANARLYQNAYNDYTPISKAQFDRNQPPTPQQPQIPPLRDAHVEQALLLVLGEGGKVDEAEAREGKVVGAADVPAVGFAAPV
ncbi:hypothetical protein B0H12DRAFT_1328830 [Mycena haematopus]|nr:hypothetical protein B0H12DRAFT_1328830 [Mycena haematopus]